MKKLADVIRGKKIYLMLDSKIIVRISKEALIEVLKDMRKEGIGIGNIEVRAETELSVLLKYKING